MSEPCPGAVCRNHHQTTSNSAAVDNTLRTTDASNEAEHEVDEYLRIAERPERTFSTTSCDNGDPYRAETTQST